MPGTSEFQQYPAARLGFILASPVLLLNEGTRTVTITLDCTLDEDVCNELSQPQFPEPPACCGHLPPAITGTPPAEDIYPRFSPLGELYAKMAAALNTKYYYVSESIIAQLITKGVSNEVVDLLRSFLTTTDKVISVDQPAPYCYCPNETTKFDTIVEMGDFEKLIDINIDAIGAFFQKRKPLRLSFSGDKEWVEPNKDNLVAFVISPGAYSRNFQLTITAVLTPEVGAVTFYNKKKP